MERQTATVAVIFWWGSALAPRKQDTYNPIKTSCLRRRLPFHAFQPAFSWMWSRKVAIKTLLFPSIQKKNKTGRGNVHFLWSKWVSCGTPWYFSESGNRNSRVWNLNRGPGVSISGGRGITWLGTPAGRGTYPRTPAGPKSRTLLAHGPIPDIGSPLLTV